MSEEFCDGVKILLARMETNPEDFVATEKEATGRLTRPKFHAVSELLRKAVMSQPTKSDEYWMCLSKEERHALINAYRNLKRKEFSNGVMKTLMADEKAEEPGPKRMYINPSQMALAQKLGISEQEYARQLAMAQQRNSAQNQALQGAGLSGYYGGSNPMQGIFGGSK